MSRNICFLINHRWCTDKSSKHNSKNIFFIDKTLSGLCKAELQPYPFPPQLKQIISCVEITYCQLPANLHLCNTTLWSCSSYSILSALWFPVRMTSIVKSIPSPNNLYCCCPPLTALNVLCHQSFCCRALYDKTHLWDHFRYAWSSMISRLHSINLQHLVADKGGHACLKGC